MGFNVAVQYEEFQRNFLYKVMKITDAISVASRRMICEMIAYFCQANFMDAVKMFPEADIGFEIRAYD